MTKPKKKNELVPTETKIAGYNNILKDFIELLEAARRTSARAVNTVMTATYWEMGRRLVELEQGGKKRADYGKALLKNLAFDLTAKFGRGFSERNLEQMRLFYQGWSISQTVSAKSQTSLHQLPKFPLPWSHYVKLLGVKSNEARAFYECGSIARRLDSAATGSANQQFVL